MAKTEGSEEISVPILIFLLTVVARKLPLPAGNSPNTATNHHISISFKFDTKLLAIVYNKDTMKALQISVYQVLLASRTTLGRVIMKRRLGQNVIRQASSAAAKN
jgi:hypothetical protein